MPKKKKIPIPKAETTQPTEAMTFDGAELEIEELDFDAGFEIDMDQENNLEPAVKIKSLANIYINYSNAEDFVDSVILKRDTRWFSLISGNFVFGDLIEAITVKNNWLIKEMQVATLSMGEENIYNFKNLITGGYLKKMDLIVSDYFFNHERNNLIKKIKEVLGDGQIPFTLSVARSHCKICTMEIESNGTGFVVIQGSANLRSSGNIEQVEIEENKTLYLHLKRFNDKIIKQYSESRETVGSKADFENLKF